MDTPNSKNPGFDINKWKKLSEDDPQKFEQERKILLEKVISEAPVERQQRLRGLQFQIDSIRRITKNPHNACISISQMMMDNLGKMQIALHELQDFVNGKNNNKTNFTSNNINIAKILDFKPENILET